MFIAQCFDFSFMQSRRVRSRVDSFDRRVTSCDMSIAEVPCLFRFVLVGAIQRDFVGVFNKTIIPLRLVGYEMIIANSALCASLAIYHLISNAPSWNNC